jgi:hypothetical protein
MMADDQIEGGQRSVEDNNEKDIVDKLISRGDDDEVS